MATELTHDSSVLIVGGGTWGSSTALHLARRGYKSIKVLDPYPNPSPISAGNDVNKIVELGSFAGDDPDERFVSEQLLNGAINGWLKDPVFKPYYHETGSIIAAASDEARELMNSKDGPTEADGWIPLNNAEDFRSTMPKGVLTGEFPGWTGWWKKSDCGWVHARKAMESAAKEAQRLGVSWVTGDAGAVISLIYENNDVKGALTKDGKYHYASRTILCAGANADLIFDFRNQLRPTAWTLGHIKMTPEECQLYKDLPVLFGFDRGFFMEPDEDRHELKMYHLLPFTSQNPSLLTSSRCDEHPGYVNTDPTAGRSVPFAKHQIPRESEQRIRLFLRETMPQLADRPLVFARICWCVDSPNRAFLISKHPDYPSLVIGSGDSGHGYCHIPSVGGFISDAMEEKLDGRMKESFKWRPVENRDWSDKQSRFGPPGANYVMDFQNVTEWTDIPARE